VTQRASAGAARTVPLASPPLPLPPRRTWRKVGLQEASYDGAAHACHAGLARRRHCKGRKVAREARAEQLAAAARGPACRDKAGPCDRPPGQGLELKQAGAVQQQPQQLEGGLSDWMGKEREADSSG
jgi:hypothetical protein